MRFTFLLMLSFVLISTSSIVLAKAKRLVDLERFTVAKSEYKQEVSYVITPVLIGDAPFPILSAQSVLAVDLDSETVLYEKTPDGAFLPASTTKIITALVAMDKYPLDTVLVVGNINVEGQKMHLVAGERITVENLLYGLLIASGNDAAEVLAQSYPEGRDAFIEAMNVKVKELRLENSFFDNPSGLDGNSQVTTARDLVKASIVAMQKPIFRKIVGTKEVTVKSEDGQIAHRLLNINELVGEVDGVLGVKTGWTQEARENLVTYIEREAGQDAESGGLRKIMIAVLGSQDRFGETKELINWIFENYEWKKVEVVN